MENKPRIIHDRLRKKFYCVVSGKECLVEYDYVDDFEEIMDIFHTFVPIELRGQGIAKEIYEEIVKYVKNNHLKVRPTCSYALKIFSSEKYRTYLE